MAMALNISVRRREIVKPSSPTPPDKKIVKLSLLDQLTPVVYTSLVLFYTKDHHDDLRPETRDEKSRILKASLSETLTRFYPLAGRLKDNFCVECNDKGAEFIEAEVNCLLSDILKIPDSDALKQLLPAAIESNEAVTGGHLLLVQASFFDCGGLAVGVCISHKLADAATLSAFIRSWAATARGGSSELVISPVFMGASIFPPIDFSIPTPSVELMMQQKCVTKRFVFHASKLTALKAKVATAALPNPTRVEAVSGLLWKCALTASRSSQGHSKPSVWSLAVNMRWRFEPPLPENYAGNCVGSIGPKTTEDSTDELGIQSLVGRIRKEISGLGESYIKKLQGEGALQAIVEFAQGFGNLAMSKDIEFYNCTSWCNYELYDADMGWGKPAWLSSGSASTTFKNVVVLMDSKDGHGIEVWLTLAEEDMTFFESDQELLEFALVNPAVSLSC